ncbi:MAG: SpoIIE family protein phosphatase, partial [Acidobacteriota bacterium]|nr:SpoIIE family protein phosphatase [Acidobacteriota bacterium]
MKKPILLYIPLFVLFALSLTVLAIHWNKVFLMFNAASSQIEMPLIVKGEVINLRPEAEQAGLKVKDKVVAINGRNIENTDIYFEEVAKINPDEDLNLAVARTNSDGQTENLQISYKPAKLDKNLNYYSRLVAGFLYAYILPTLCILLGFYVAFVRPKDFLAWLLLFMLLGFSAIGLEGYARNSFVGVYNNTFYNTWALSMFLFALYFPERWNFDRRFPWAKWILIVPLGFQILTGLLNNLKIFFGINIIDWLRFVNKPYDNGIGMFVNITAIGMFFFILGLKSGTLKAPDARRRMQLMLYGTMAAMMPMFGIILYGIFTNTRGSFFDRVPFWFAITALLALLLFPLTMAYVIVVHRAMDVSVVVRQGLQYALAKNGVLALQIFLSIAVVLTALSFASDATTNRPQKIIFISVGVIGVFLIRILAEKIKRWTDRKFFREAYNAEQILSDLSEDVRTMVETKPLLETVSNRISESLHVPQVALLLKNGVDFQPAYALGYKNAPNVSLNENNTTIGKLKTNEPLVIYQDDQDSWINDETQTTERANLRELNSQLLLPFGAKNELSGLISLSPKLSDSPYTPTDLRLLKSVAAQTGLALENSRLTEAIATEVGQRERINRELEIAREVQERLFPQEFPRVEGLDYFGACRSALDVGGDYYDFIELPENKFGIAIGDISGKGIGASLMMASLQASLRGQAIHFKSDLAGLMKQINSLVYEASTSNRYATFFYAQYEPATGKLAYVNAGHNPPFLIRRSGEVLRLEEGGAVVGMLPPMLVNYKQGEITLQKGDLIVGS